MLRSGDALKLHRGQGALAEGERWAIWLAYDWKGQADKAIA